MSSVPKFTIRELMDAGVHYGHKTMRWNPKMAPYIYGERDKIHIINLQKTMPLLHRALETVTEIAGNNGRILFVSTKRQASPLVAEAAKRCGQFYVNHRWLGGMLTNWQTVSKSISLLEEITVQLANPDVILAKKERLTMERKAIKLENVLGGIKDMSGLPQLIFVIDTNKEHIAIQEAKTLGIPVIGIVDTNSSPDDIDHIIPGNDDAIRSIQLYCDLISEAVLAGLQHSVGESAAKAAKETSASLAAPTEKAVKLDEKTVKVAGKGAVKVEAKAKKKVAKKEEKTAEPKAEEAKKEATEAATDKPAEAKKAVSA